MSVNKYRFVPLDSRMHTTEAGGYVRTDDFEILLAAASALLESMRLADKWNSPEAMKLEGLIRKYSEVKP